MFSFSNSLRHPLSLYFLPLLLLAIQSSFMTLAGVSTSPHCICAAGYPAPVKHLHLLFFSNPSANLPLPLPPCPCLSPLHSPPLPCSACSTTRTGVSTSPHCTGQAECPPGRLTTSTDLSGSRREGTRCYAGLSASGNSGLSLTDGNKIRDNTHSKKGPYFCHCSLQK